jgi:GT2 family glycosyltransferase
MDLSICILTRNQEALLRQGVACCLPEIERAGLSAEIIIIDNASTDGSVQRVIAQARSATTENCRFSIGDCRLTAEEDSVSVQSVPHGGSNPQSAIGNPQSAITVRVLRNEENLGFSAANNRAIRASYGRFVLILNDDAFLQEGSLKLLMEKIESSPRIGVVGPKLLNLDGSLQRSFTNRRFPRFHSLIFGFLGLNPLLEGNRLTRAWFTHGQDPEQSAETDHIAGACLLARREALVAVRLFDEGFQFLFEDTDLCYRLKQAGWSIFYVAEARVIHRGSASLRRLDWFERRIIFMKSLLRFFKKHASPRKYFLVRVVAMGALFVQMPFAVLFSLAARRPADQERGGSLRTSLRRVRSVLREERSSLAEPRSGGII